MVWYTVQSVWRVAPDSVLFGLVHIMVLHGMVWYNVWCGVLLHIATRQAPPLPRVRVAALLPGHEAFF